MTTFAKLRGKSGWNPLSKESSYANNCKGIIANKKEKVLFSGI